MEAKTTINDLFSGNRIMVPDYQRAYSSEEMCDIIGKSGLKLVGIHDGYSDKNPEDESERITFICRESGKSP